MQTILITGGAGYIGSVLVPMLLSRDHKVVVLDQFYFGQESLPKHPRLTCIKQDSRRILPEQLQGIDCVVDLAAMSNDPCGESFARLTAEVNHLARFRTAKLARMEGVRRYILPSSCSVYGYQAGIADENSATNPLTHYAKANLSAENDVLPLANDEYCVTVLRLATVFGDSPRMRLDLVVNSMTYDSLRMREIHVAGGGTQTRPLIHVKDVAAALISAIHAAPEKINRQTLNVGCDSMNYAINGIAEAVSFAYYSKFSSICRIVHNGPQDLRSYKVSFKKIKELLDWSPEISLEIGARSLMDKLESGDIKIDEKCYTLDWYCKLLNQGTLVRETAEKSL